MTDKKDPTWPKVEAAMLASAEAEAHRLRSEARAKRRREQWGDGGREGMTLLARSFPMLRSAAGVDPWDPAALIRWACSPAITSGGMHAVHFCLQVWNSTADWPEAAAAVLREAGEPEPDVEVLARVFAPFNLVAAFGAWDDEHRAACLAWCEAPFWP